MKKLMMAIMLFVVSATPAFAVSTTATYSSPLLVLLFVGFCALVIVAQLVPAILVLVGATKAVAAGARESRMVKVKN